MEQGLAQMKQELKIRQKEIAERESVIDAAEYLHKIGATTEILSPLIIFIEELTIEKNISTQETANQVRQMLEFINLNNNIKRAREQLSAVSPNN